MAYRTTVIRNLMNSSNNNSGGMLEYEWDRDHPLITSGVLKVYPNHGKIPFNSLVMCKMTLKPGFTPEMIDTNISCRVCVSDSNNNNNRRRGRGKNNSRRGSTAASRRSGVNGGGSVASSIANSISRGGNNNNNTVSSSSSHTSVVRRTTAASRGGRPESTQNNQPPQSIGTGGGGGSRMGTAHSTASFSSSSSNNIGSGMNVGPSMLLFAQVHAVIVRPDVYRQYHKEERNAINKFYIPQKDPPTTAASNNNNFGAESMNPEEGNSTAANNHPPKTVQDLATEVMTQLVEDLMDDPFVKHLVEDMPPAKTPFFVQLKNQQTKQGEGSTPDYGNLPSSSSSSTKEEVKEEMGGTMSSTMSSTMTIEDRKKLLKTSETQDLLSRIMENTFFNLISEVAHGEINLNVEPRRMVIPEASSTATGN